MSFWKSSLLKNLEDGKLPEVETRVVFDQKSMIMVGSILFVLAAGIALLVVAVKRSANA